MSVIYSDDELRQIEKLLGRTFIVLYEKLWAERNSVKNYLSTVEQNLKSAEGHSRTYWEYKLGEVKTVMANQSKWLRKVMEPLKGKISDDMYSRLEKYLEEHEVENQ